MIRLDRSDLQKRLAREHATLRALRNELIAEFQEIQKLATRTSAQLTLFLRNYPLSALETFELFKMTAGGDSTSALVRSSLSWTQGHEELYQTYRQVEELLVPYLETLRQEKECQQKVTILQRQLSALNMVGE